MVDNSVRNWYIFQCCFFSKHFKMLSNWSFMGVYYKTCPVGSGPVSVYRSSTGIPDKGCDWLLFQMLLKLYPWNQNRLPILPVPFYRCTGTIPVPLEYTSSSDWIFNHIPWKLEFLDKKIDSGTVCWGSMCKVAAKGPNGDELPQ